MVLSAASIWNIHLFWGSSPVFSEKPPPKLTSIDPFRASARSAPVRFRGSAVRDGRHDFEAGEVRLARVRVGGAGGVVGRCRWVDIGGHFFR